MKMKLKAMLITNNKFSTTWHQDIYVWLRFYSSWRSLELLISENSFFLHRPLFCLLQVVTPPPHFRESYWAKGITWRCLWFEIRSKLQRFSNNFCRDSMALQAWEWLCETLYLYRGSVLVACWTPLIRLKGRIEFFTNLEIKFVALVPLLMTCVDTIHSPLICFESKIMANCPCPCSFCDLLRKGEKCKNWEIRDIHMVQLVDECKQ